MAGAGQLCSPHELVDVLRSADSPLAFCSHCEKALHTPAGPVEQHATHSRFLGGWFQWPGSSKQEQQPEQPEQEQEDGKQDAEQALDSTAEKPHQADGATVLGGAEGVTTRQCSRCSLFVHVECEQEWILATAQVVKEDDAVMAAGPRTDDTAARVEEGTELAPSDASVPAGAAVDVADAGMWRKMTSSMSERVLGVVGDLSVAGVAARLFGDEFVEGALDIQQSAATLAEEHRSHRHAILGAPALDGAPVLQSTAAAAGEDVDGKDVKPASVRADFGNSELLWALLMVMSHQKKDEDTSKSAEFDIPLEQLRELVRAYKYALLVYGPTDTAEMMKKWITSPIGRYFDMNPAASAETADSSQLYELTGIPIDFLLDEQPSSGYFSAAHAVFIDPGKGELVIAIRGSKQVSDWFTNFNCGTADLYADETRDGDVLMHDASNRSGSAEQAMAHAGMVKAVRKKLFGGPFPLINIVERVLRSKEGQFEKVDHVAIYGHSLGAGSAVLLALLLRQTFSRTNDLRGTDVRCTGFATPGVLSSELAAAESTRSICTSLIFNHDVVPRLSATSLIRLQVYLESVLHRTEDESTSTTNRVKQLLGKGPKLASNAFDEPDLPIDDGKMQIPGELIHLRPQDDPSKFESLQPSREQFDRIVFRPRMVSDHRIVHYGEALHYLCTVAAKRHSLSVDAVPSKTIFSPLTEYLTKRKVANDVSAIAKSAGGQWIQIEDEHPRLTMQGSLEGLLFFARIGIDSEFYQDAMRGAKGAASGLKARVSLRVWADILLAESRFQRDLDLLLRYRDAMMTLVGGDDVSEFLSLLPKLEEFQRTVVDQLVEAVPKDRVKGPANSPHIATANMLVIADDGPGDLAAEVSSSLCDLYAQKLVPEFRRLLKTYAHVFEKAVATLLENYDAEDGIFAKSLRLEQRMLVAMFGRVAELGRLLFEPFRHLACLHGLITEFKAAGQSQGEVSQSTQSALEAIEKAFNAVRRCIRKRNAVLMVLQVQQRLIPSASVRNLNLADSSREFVKQGWVHAQFGGNPQGMIDADEDFIARQKSSVKISAVPGGFYMTFVVLFNDVLLFCGGDRTSALAEWWSGSNQAPSALYLQSVFRLDQLTISEVGSHGIMIEHEDTSSGTVGSADKIHTSRAAKASERVTLLLCRSVPERTEWHRMLIETMSVVLSKPTLDSSMEPSNAERESLRSSGDLLKPERFSGFLSTRASWTLQLSLTSVRRFYRLYGKTLFVFADDVEGTPPNDSHSLAGYTVASVEEESKKITLQPTGKSSSKPELIFYADSPEQAAYWREVLKT